MDIVPVDRPTKFNPVPAGRKAEIIELAKDRILAGDTMDEIGADNGITGRTLNTWMMALGDEYTALRQAWIDNMLSASKAAIDNADEQFPLARAREQWKAATWYAERRDRQRYGQQPEITVNVGISLSGALAEVEARRVVDGETG